MRDALALLALGLGAFFFWKRANANSLEIDDSFLYDLPPFDYEPPIVNIDIPEFTIDDYFPVEYEPPFVEIPIPDVLFDDGDIELDNRIKAFLNTIRRAEHTYPNYASNMDYVVAYGEQVFSSFADHPAITGEMKPVKLPDKYCKAVGLKPGCVSTAAGAYQITKSTWNEFRQAGSWGEYLPDFSPVYQDEAARRILIKLGVIPFLIQGKIADAIAIASTRWASLPSSKSGQPKRTYAEVLAWYSENLANLPRIG